MSGSLPRPMASVTILRRDGDPFETESLESAPPAEEPAHVAILHKLFYDSTVDLGSLVRIDRQTYLCTRAGWRIVPAASER
jgi:hypothetical protein